MNFGSIVRNILLLQISKECSKHDEIKKKTCQPTKLNGCRSRCNSSLSAQEIEFQNWKRRKSYDPLKAAAEDRKKKLLMHSTAASCSASSTVIRNKKISYEPNENRYARGKIPNVYFHI